MRSFDNISRARQAPRPFLFFQIAPGESQIQFAVQASVAIEGTFDQWEASLTFTSTAAESAALDVKLQAASVNTGSGLKDGTLKSKDFFNVDEDPLITFHSTTIVQTGPEPLMSRARLPFAASPSPRPCT